MARLLLHKTPRIYRAGIESQLDLSDRIRRRGCRSAADLRRAAARPWPRANGADSRRPKPASVDAVSGETGVTPTPSCETPPLIVIPSRCDSPSPLRRAAHLGLVCPYSLGDAQYLGRITQHYRQCREATVLQIVHRERPAVLYPQASRSPHTESGYRLYRYPIMSIGMHLQCRMQL